jgi:hypothetical protein
VQHRKVCKGFGKVPFPQVLVPFELSCFLTVATVMLYL